MLASHHGAVSSSLTSLPAFETEHRLFLAEQELHRRHPLKDGPSCGYSAALQAVADAYIARRAGDRGDNIARAAALLARAASLPAVSECEKAARASSYSRLARALLARAAYNSRGASLAADVEPESPKKEKLPSVPAFLQLVHEPDVRVSVVAHKALIASVKAAVLPTEEAGDIRGSGNKKSDKNKQSSEEEINKQNLMAALYVDRARALCIGASVSGAIPEEQVAARVDAAISALEHANKIRVPGTRRERAAGALADILLATLYARERMNNGDLAEADRIRAGRLYRSAGTCLTGLFASASDSDSAVSESPPTSPLRTHDEFAQGSDCSEESIGTSAESPVAAKDNEKGEDERRCVKVPPQDSFEPFVTWDLDQVRRFVDSEMRRLGPVMHDGENRRSCTIC